MGPWKIWKSGFDRWESATAEYLDQALQSPAFLGPTGTLLKAVMQSKSATNKAMARGWNKLGLMSREDQDKALHRINQLESLVMDLREEIEDLREKQ
jgi:hypothetical protein